ncbi:MAG: pyridoxamine 5'-phosphate oxidase family protein [Ilumatobacteraceae bacterium]
MSRTVEFADVQRRITEFGERATLITVTADHRPHVVTGLIQPIGDHLATRVGSRTAANLAERPAITLTWSPLPGGDYILILDGTAELNGDPGSDGVTEITISVERGILHRVAELPASGPTCIAL